MAPIYQQLTFAQAKTQLAARLFDAGKVFWSDAELGLYIIEALRTWNAMTSFWRGDFTFPAATGVTWYDLTDTTNLPNTLRPLTLADRDLYTIMQYHLLESIAWNPWTGVSKQFSDTDLVNAVSRNRDETLGIVGCTCTRRLVPAVGGRIVLPDSVIDVRRMAYLPAVGSPSVVWSGDTWSEQAFDSGFPNLPPGTPSTYRLSTEPPISFDTDRPPGAAGQYELLTVEAGPNASIATATGLVVPDDWTHVIKWGALADLLSRDSYARDTLRAQYATQRYRMGLALMSVASALLALRIANKTLQVDAITDGDQYRTGWQAEAPREPDSAFHVGLNLAALAPVPDAGPYMLTATVVTNAPVPTVDGDFLQAARDDLEAVIDYSQHLASFKMGGAEFAATMPLLERFIKQAATYNSKLREMGEFTEALYGLSQRQEREAPRMAPVEAT